MKFDRNVGMNVYNFKIYYFSPYIMYIASLQPPNSVPTPWAQIIHFRSNQVQFMYNYYIYCTFLMVRCGLCILDG